MKVVSRPASCTHAYVCSQHQLRNDPKSKPCPRRASYGLKNLTVRQPLLLKTLYISTYCSQNKPERTVRDGSRRDLAFRRGRTLLLHSSASKRRAFGPMYAVRPGPKTQISRSALAPAGSAPTPARKRSGAGAGRPSCHRPGRWCGISRPWHPVATRFPPGS